MWDTGHAEVAHVLLFPKEISIFLPLDKKKRRGFGSEIDNYKISDPYPAPWGYIITLQIRVDPGPEHWYLAEVGTFARTPLFAEYKKKYFIGIFKHTDGDG